METSTNNAKAAVVSSFINAMNEEDFQKARTYVNKDLVFEGVLGSRNGADLYFNDMEKMKLKYEVQKMIAEGSDVSVLYDISMSGVKVPTCGWYTLKNEKISLIKVIFDPRPVFAETVMDSESDSGERKGNLAKWKR